MMWEEYYSVLRQLPDWLKKPVPFVVDSSSLFREYEAQIFLDLGCGMGRNSIYLGKEGFDVIGVDVSRSALKKTKAWAKIEGVPSMAVLRCSMTNLPFVRQTFHVVISVSVIHHAVKEEIKKAMEEIHKALKDNGLFLANLLSIGDYRYGSGLKIEDGTFQISEDFEAKQFKEVHHFFSQKEIQTLLGDFKWTSIVSIQSGKQDQPYEYWKVIAEK